MTTAQQAWEEWDALVGDVGCGAEPVARIVRSLLVGEALTGADREWLEDWLGRCDAAVTAWRRWEAARTVETVR